MSEPQTQQVVSAGVPPRACFRLSQVALWLPLCLVHGSAVAWLAFGVQKHFAPLLIFPALVGLTLGVTLAGSMRLVQVAGQSVVLMGAVVACGVAVFGQHYFSFQEHRQAAERETAEFRMAARAYPDLVQGTPFEPPSGLVQFLRRQAIRGRLIVGNTIARGPWAWASWALDGCITLLATLLIILPASRQPYCDQCRSWFRTLRRGRLGSALAAEIAAEVGAETPEDAGNADYRLVGCQGGCGVAGFEICWKLPNGRVKTARTWVSAEDRNRLENAITAGCKSSNLSPDNSPPLP